MDSADLTSSDRRSEVSNQDGLIDNSARQIDLPSLFWRRKWLLLIGLCTGLLLGYLYNAKQTPVYRSSAQVQVIEPYTKNLPVEAIESGSLGAGGLVDEALVIKSERLMVDAAKLGKLQTLNRFAGMTDEHIALSLTQTLKVEPANQDKNRPLATTVFDIHYDSTDPSETQTVVQAIVDAYAEHLRSQHRDVGNETLELIKNARGEVATKLEALEREFDDFKRRATLVSRTSIHRENADKYLVEIQSLQIEKTRLESRILAAKEAMRNGQPLGSVLLSLTSDEGSATDVIGANAEAKVALGRPELPRAEQFREKELVPLQLKERELLSIYGASHPAVKDIQSQIKIVEGQLAETRRNDELLKAQEERLQQALQDSSATDEQREAIAELIKLHLLAADQRLVGLNKELEVAQQQYEAEMEEARRESTMEIEWAKYEREVERQQALYDKIVARLDELDIVSSAEGMRVVALNTPKYGYQVSPVLAKSLGFGAAGGFMLMCLLAYLFELSNSSYRSAEEIAEHLHLPVVGQIPVFLAEAKAKRVRKDLKSKLSPILGTHFLNKSQHSEAYRAIRTALYFSNQGHGEQVLQVTSAVPADGKTTIASNVAVSIAQSGKSVLLMDCDLRRPQVHKVFGIEAERGSAWLIQNTPTTGNFPSENLGEVIRETEIPNLSVLPVGKKPDNPSELLSSANFDRLLAALRKKFDVIIIDSPPLLAVTDPSTIAPRVDGVVMVVRLRRNVRPLAAQAARILETLDAKVLGVVVNGIGSREAGEYGKFYRRDGYYNRGYYYRYGYGYTYGYTYGSQNKEYKKYYVDDEVRPNGKPLIAAKKVEEPVALKS